ncbi:MAG: HAD family hydrolase [Bacillota bacterium]|nr:HAD family hydrolase [Bacillota bacterium]
MMHLSFVPDGIFFDLDGTLWDSVAEISAAWQKRVALYPELDIHFSEDDVRACMGLSIDAIAHRLMPGLPKKEALLLMDECLEEEYRYLRRAGGKIYPGVGDVLAALSCSFPLFIASNCQQGYIENFLEFSGFGGFFRDSICFGDTQQSKGQNILQLCRKHGLKQGIFLGDTETDRLAAEEAQIPFLWAAYGFGKVESYLYRIDSFPALLSLLDF